MDASLWPQIDAFFTDPIEEKRKLRMCHRNYFCATVLNMNAHFRQGFKNNSPGKNLLRGTLPLPPAPTPTNTNTCKPSSRRFSTPDEALAMSTIQIQICGNTNTDTNTDTNTNTSTNTDKNIITYMNICKPIQSPITTPDKNMNTTTNMEIQIQMQMQIQ